MKSTIFFIMLGLSLFLIISPALAHQPVIPGKGITLIENPVISRAFYDSLAGASKLYRIESKKDFNLYVNLLVPKSTNADGRYSARIYSLSGEVPTLIYRLDQESVNWTEFYEPFAGDTYLKGPEFKKHVPAGSYEIEVYNLDNQGKYVLAVGEKEYFGPMEIWNTLVILPGLKINFFNANPLSLLLTPMGLFYIAGIGLLIFMAVKIVV